MFEKTTCPPQVFVMNKKRIILREYAQRGNGKELVDELPRRYVGRSSACVVICSTRRFACLHSAHNEGLGQASSGRRSMRASEDIHLKVSFSSRDQPYVINHVTPTTQYYSRFASYWDRLIIRSS